MTFFFAKFFSSCGKFIAEEEILKSFILIFEITHILSLHFFLMLAENNTTASLLKKILKSNNNDIIIFTE